MTECADITEIARQYKVGEADVLKALERFIIRLRESGLEPAAVSLREAVEQALYWCVLDDLPAAQHDAFDAEISP